MSEDSTVSGAAIAKALGIDRSTWHRWVASGLTPAPTFVDPRLKLWDSKDIKKWCAALNRLEVK